MSNVATHGEHAATYQREEVAHTSGWTGWIGFGGFMMILTGLLHIIDGFVGLYRSSFYLASSHSSQVIVFSNVRTWAWVNLIAGVIVAIAGLSLFSGTMWSRVVAVFLSVLAIAVNLLAIALYPLWSIIAIGFAILVIYAVTVHGGELKHE